MKVFNDCLFSIGQSVITNKKIEPFNQYCMRIWAEERCVVEDIEATVIYSTKEIKYRYKIRNGMFAVNWCDEKGIRKSE